MIVYKYGGTTLLNEEGLLETVREGLREHQRIILIVSAIGRYPAPYSTDALFKMCDNVTEKEKARVVSCGEVISSVYISNLLNTNNINAISLSIYDINLCYKDGFTVSDKIKRYVEDYEVVIIPGFIGLCDNEPVLLPRGGSNITASFFAYYFNCDLVVFTDVDGLYSEDPKTNKEAKKINLLSYDLLKELTKKNPTLFPLEGIRYLEKGNVVMIIRNTCYSLGSVIRKK